MLIRTWGFVATKPHSPWVSVEVRAERGALVRTSGLPPGAAQESMARLRSALAHVGFRPPTQSLTLHLHPNCTKEDVPHLDLAFAAALLTLAGRLQAQDLLHTAFVGTLTLSGHLHDPRLGHATGLLCRGAVPHPEIQRLIHAPGGDSLLPDNHSLEQSWEISDLLQLMSSTPSWQNLNASPSPNPVKAAAHPQDLHWEEIQGEGHAKTWLAIAAKHRLPVLMSGPPGCGKTSLAKMCVGLRAQRLQMSNVPWLAPHPAGGVAGLLGAWRRGAPQPGAWAQADGGVLFLDEFLEWPRPARESLRHVMETDRLELHRAEGSAVWMSKPWIVAATNPCACGRGNEQCLCTPAEQKLHRRKCSAPLLERFAVQLDVGHDPWPCPKSWNEVFKWLSRPFPIKGIPWKSHARDSWMNSDIRREASRRVRASTERLAEAHADWRGENKVTREDVGAAVDVTWMTREGW